MKYFKLIVQALWTEFKCRYRRYEQEKRNCLVRIYPPVFYLQHNEEYCNQKEQEQLAIANEMIAD